MAGKKFRVMEVAAVNACHTWRLSAEDTTIILNDGGADLVVGIYVGLHALFGGNKEAVGYWINSPNESLDGQTPASRILAKSLPGLRDVADALNLARGLRP